MAYIDKVNYKGTVYDVKAEVKPEDISAITYSKDEINLLMDDKADVDDVYSKDEIDAAISGFTDVDEVGEIVSANCYTKEESDAKYLTEHQPLKTINNQSLIGTGNIDIGTGGTVTVDETLSSSSTNPVQNKVITSAITSLSGKTENIYNKSEVDEKLALKANAADVYTQRIVDGLLADKSNTGHTHTKADITDFPTNLVSGQTQGYTISVLTQEQWASISGNPNPNYIYLVKE